ncbi:MAG: FAD-dependent oxidoreductase [Desulfurococcaceae archaeon]
MKFGFLCRERGGGRGRVAVVGAGPAGLAATGYLACLGYEVDVYDKLPYAGGLMMFAIPVHRIPPDNIIDGVEDLKDRLSVKFNFKVKVFVKDNSRHDEGDDFVERTIPLDDLITSYDAVLITTGTWSSRKLGVEGENAINVITALEYLYRWRLYEEKLLPNKPPSGKKVVVVGAGLSAVDAAEKAHMDGAEVNLVYRRTAAEAPAGLYNIRHLVSLGINFVELAQPVKVLNENRVAKGLELVKMRLGEPDESGRPRPIPVPGSEFVMEADLIILAVGELPTPPFTSGYESIATDKTGRIVVNEFHQTTITNVFAAGDVVTGPSMIGKAFGSGLRAAKFLDNYLTHIAKQVAMA